MSDNEKIAFFDIKIDKSGVLQFDAMLLNAQTLNDVDIWSFKIRPDEVIEDFDSDIIYNMLNGRVWMGHDIEKVDTPLLKAEFRKIGKPAPTAKSIIDTLHFTSSDTELAKLAIQFGLGRREAYRSFKDCGKNLKAIKKCEAFMPSFVKELPEIKYENDVHPMLCVLKYYHEAVNARRLSEPGKN
ncbi:unnamed protein product [Microthlaspi erraticum]|uniref:Exonuclease domain-containing protein n=1 Tax=Microthlaspi erraticum TaxID=1685480 RepID=A0A6D2I320_9BRAS|nr:unnamed protein product [Microthlaspi erraticum]